jgi:uncharacterized protein with HEPN domain
VREAKSHGHDIKQFYQDHMLIDPSIQKDIIGEPSTEISAATRAPAQSRPWAKRAEVLDD